MAYLQQRLSDDKESEIIALREQWTETRRPRVQALEDMLYEVRPVLDHGFVRVVDYMGDDAAIVQAARVSYGSGTKQSRQDEGLIRYLLRHAHTTPFEMCEIKLHVKLPVFVARQWIRHRTANVNEYSARYSVMDDEFYIPEIDHLATQGRDNRQGRGRELNGKEAAAIQLNLRRFSEDAYGLYLQLLNEDIQGQVASEHSQGVARELARLVLPLNVYTQWYWKIDLHNLLHFLRLRWDDHAQFEIREYAREIANIVEKWVPTTYKAFEDYRRGAVTLSKQWLEIVRRMLAGEQVTQLDSGLNVREWRELRVALFGDDGTQGAQMTMQFTQPPVEPRQRKRPPTPGKKTPSPEAHPIQQLV